METPKVIYQDDDVLVLDKPSGWVVNDAKTAHGNPILQNWLKENYNYPISQSIEKRSGIVHRLDKETSGLLLIAKNEAAFDGLQSQFKERLVKKTYSALVHGKFNDMEGVISEPVGRLPWNRERFGVLPSGKASLTEYCVTASYLDKQKNMYSLLELLPKTGRTHQIRVHLKSINHPIVSDLFYAGRKTSRKDRLWCPRLFLHAGVIGFKNPGSGKAMSLNSSLPADLNSALAKLSLLI
ncbi:MAG: Pseudouridine synthase [Candidatus Woesebacteria bacterium GW2011_GWA1_39_21]|uniref:Pseudouridine synthase n=1 Tax=Candidatus Woesebacteria bacterium GW2011_GWA1_39_21 TaxID=1618550 RepID=A0A0G0QNK9_9BACT|nr:MAG: Pseudouridine synthase [Candidatus Woesebacteria bacterium GW2011_GWA1_39_21]